jgi:hypothetical protein
MEIDLQGGDVDLALQQRACAVGIEEPFNLALEV